MTHNKDRCSHLWRMRWFTLIAFVLIFSASLLVIVLTKNALLLPLPGSILLAMRPMIRWVFSQPAATEESQITPRHKRRRKMHRSPVAKTD